VLALVPVLNAVALQLAHTALVCHSLTHTKGPKPSSRCTQGHEGQLHVGLLMPAMGQHLEKVSPCLDSTIFAGAGRDTNDVPPTSAGMFRARATESLGTLILLPSLRAQTCWAPSHSRSRICSAMPQSLQVVAQGNGQLWESRHNCLGKADPLIYMCYHVSGAPVDSIRATLYVNALALCISCFSCL
jgi:hypothetical protein